MPSPEEFKSKRHDEEQVDYFYLAIVVSLVVHLFGMLAWNVEKHYHVLPKDLFSFLHHVDPSRLLIEKKEKPKPQPRPITFRFVDVNPEAVSAPPKQTNFEGARNSQAANEKPAKKDQGKPKLDGKQQDMIRDRDVKTPTGPITKPTPASAPKPPAPKPPQKAAKKPEPPKPEPTPKAPPPPPKMKVTRVAKAVTPKPAPKSLPAPKQEPQKPSPPPAPKTRMTPLAPPGPKRVGRPRSLRDAKARLVDSGLVGEKSKMDGGVTKQGKSSLDVLRTAFGAYGEHMFFAMEGKWKLLADQRSPIPVGTVVVSFRVHQSGRISDVRTDSTEVNDLHTAICQMAVRDPSPYPRWPTALLKRYPLGYHDITVTFRYR